MSATPNDSALEPESLRDVEDGAFVQKLADAAKDIELQEDEAKTAEAYESSVEEERKTMMVVMTLVDATIARQREGTR